MSSEALFAAVNLLLPEVLVSHFELTRHIIKGEELAPSVLNIRVALIT